MTHGDHWLGHWSRTQGSVALSSAEAELNASTTGGSEGLFLKGIAKDMGTDLEVTIIEDSSASVGIAEREGAGRVKHLEAKQLWIQERVLERRLGVRKVHRSGNSADILTHHWTSTEAEKFFDRLHMVFPMSEESAFRCTQRQTTGERDGSNEREHVYNSSADHGSEGGSRNPPMNSQVSAVHCTYDMYKACRLEGALYPIIFEFFSSLDVQLNLGHSIDLQTH